MSTNWTRKDPGENFLVDFNFPDATANLTGATVTVEVISGTDATPAALLVGSPVTSGKLVQQRVDDGIPGCRYRFRCVATDGTSGYTLVTTMPVAYAVEDTGLTAVSDYTTYNEVRAALGVSDEEVGDGVLELPMYGNHLAMEFGDLATTLSLATDVEETYATLRAVALNTLTKPQKRVLASLSLFATYAVARHLGTSLAMMAPKSLGDGKALMSRFSDSPYKSTLTNVEQQYEKAKASLGAALAALSSTTATTLVTTFMGVSSPAVDQVTGS